MPYIRKEIMNHPTACDEYCEKSCKWLPPIPQDLDSVVRDDNDHNSSSQDCFGASPQTDDEWEDIPTTTDMPAISSLPKKRKMQFLVRLLASDLVDAFVFCIFSSVLTMLDVAWIYAQPQGPVFCAVLLGLNLIGFMMSLFKLAKRRKLSRAHATHREQELQRLVDENATHRAAIESGLQFISGLEDNIKADLATIERFEQRFKEQSEYLESTRGAIVRLNHQNCSLRDTIAADRATISRLEDQNATLDIKAQECNDLKTNNRSLAEENTRYRDLVDTMLRHPSYMPFIEEFSKDPAVIGGASSIRLPGSVMAPASASTSARETPVDVSMLNINNSGGNSFSVPSNAGMNSNINEVMAAWKETTMQAIESSYRQAWINQARFKEVERLTYALQASETRNLDTQALLRTLRNDMQDRTQHIQDLKGKNRALAHANAAHHKANTDQIATLKSEIIHKNTQFAELTHAFNFEFAERQDTHNQAVARMHNETKALADRANKAEDMLARITNDRSEEYVYWKACLHKRDSENELLSQQLRDLTSENDKLSGVAEWEQVESVPVEDDDAYGSTMSCSETKGDYDTRCSEPELVEVEDFTSLHLEDFEEVNLIAENDLEGGLMCLRRK